MTALTWFRSLFERPTSATTHMPSSPAMHYAAAYLGEDRVRQMLADAGARHVPDESSDESEHWEEAHPALRLVASSTT